MSNHIEVGNLTRDPEVKFSESGMAVTRFAIASNYKKKNGEEITSYYDVVCFGSTAENVSKSLVKGDRVVVTGRQEVRTYERKDGTTGTSVEIIADEVGAALRFNVVSPVREKRAMAGTGARKNNAYEDSGYEPF